MWKRKLQFSSSLLRCGGDTSLLHLSNTIKHYTVYISPYNSSIHQLTQKSFNFSNCNNLLPSSIQNLKNPGLHFNFCSDTSKFKCWNCNAATSDNNTPFLFCEACRSVQPVDHSINYFQIFGLEKKYDIAEGSLEGKYKDWQKKLHPDLVHTKSQGEREYAAEQSARVTTSYRTLSVPIARAKYILKLEGVDVDEEERISDPEILSEIMEIREAVEEASDTQTLNRIKEQMQKELGNWSRFFADAFQSKNYDKALASIQRMTYYKRAIEEIIKKL